MDTRSMLVISFFLAVLVLCSRAYTHSLETYVVYVEWPESPNFVHPQDLENYYTAFLPTSQMSGESRLVHSYGEAIKGFAARLTREEVLAMESMEGFLSAHPDRLLPLHTTHTPGFLGLVEPTSPFVAPSGSGAEFGEGIIIGLLDTGLIPDHPSLRGEGMPPPPARWKGQCKLPEGLCNNKLIGYKSFINQTESVLEFDYFGHGTHTSSTAAGALVDSANILGQANGTAVGMAPRAHVAMYQVCQYGGCMISAILAGLNAAVEDGVDVLSISLGGGSEPFYLDPIAIGAFRAMERNVFVSCSAGNSGPTRASLSNEAPWYITVAASTTDRSTRATVRLGDGREFEGETLYQPKSWAAPMVPLAMAASAKGFYCSRGSLRGTDVKGKIVLCGIGGIVGSVEKGDNVKKAGGIGMILVNGYYDGYSTEAYNHTIPASYLSYADGEIIKAYMNSTTNPVGTIVFKGTVFGVLPSPTITSFSSRGPNRASRGILKPDITGPGVNILAAWPRVFDRRPEAQSSAGHSFNIISGTSMSAPHLSGIGARIKSMHPDWSPAAIKSAIMTTAYTSGLDGEPIKDEQRAPATAFAMGAGHVNPRSAVDPGLVYDITIDDYISYICRLHYNNTQVATIVGRKISCSNVRLPVRDLNYPSIAIGMGIKPVVVVKRTVTNVGPAVSDYTVRVIEPAGVVVVVEPESLHFGEVNETKSFKVIFIGKDNAPQGYSEGSLSWVSSKHVVRSPIVVTFS